MYGVPSPNCAGWWPASQCGSTSRLQYQTDYLIRYWSAMPDRDQVTRLKTRGKKFGLDTSTLAPSITVRSSTSLHPLISVGFQLQTRLIAPVLTPLSLQLGIGSQTSRWPPQLRLPSGRSSRCLSSFLHGQIPLPWDLDVINLHTGEQSNVSVSSQMPLSAHRTRAAIGSSTTRPPAHHPSITLRANSCPPTMPAGRCALKMR